LLEEKGPLAFGFYSGALVAEDERHGLHGQLVERFRGQLGEAAYTFVACLFALGISGLAAYLADVPVPVWGAKEGARSSV
jgi:hypothetical protein